MKAFVLTHTMSFLPENSIGNLLWIAVAKVAGKGDLVSLVRDSMSKLDGEFVKNMRGDKGKVLSN